MVLSKNQKKINTKLLISKRINIFDDYSEYQYDGSFDLYQKQPSRSVKVKLLIEITLRHGCSPVNLLHIFRTPFSMNTSGTLLL